MNSQGMLATCSLLRRERMARQMMNTQTNRARVSSTWKTKGRSRYSHCWANSGPLAQLRPCWLAPSARQDRTTTAVAAMNRVHTSTCCFFGSRLAMNGVRNRPAASSPMAVQNKESWTCQVRAREKGRSRPRSKPKKDSTSAR